MIVLRGCIGRTVRRRFGIIRVFGTLLLYVFHFLVSRGEEGYTDFY
jgi:hypothetical protein